MSILGMELIFYYGKHQFSIINDYIYKQNYENDKNYEDYDIGI